MIGHTPGLVGLGDAAALAEWLEALGYWAVFLAVAGDAVLPLLPAEPAVAAAAVLAAAGELSLPLVILAAALGAFVGDSTAYWIGRAGRGPLVRRLGRLAGQDRLATAERLVQRRGPALVIVGRFIPFLRLAVNLSCGAGSMAYRRFAPYSAIGSTLWAVETALVAFFVGRAIEGRLWLGFVVGLAASGLVIAAMATVGRWVQRRSASAAPP